MKLRLKNFKGIKAGPELTWDGMDEIEIDFTDKKGLIAFSGENGGGKTTCLESLSHFPQLVSRDGALWSHCLGRAAEKEFISTFMGHEYRSVIKMDADQGKQEGYLWIDGKPSVNGKITAYREKVNEIFGQPFTYFRSQFCPQKSKKTKDMQIENMTTGVFRELLREFLNLQKYAVWEDTAKQCANIYQGQAGQLDSRITVLQEATAKKEEIMLAYLEAGSKAEGLRDDKTLLEMALVEKRQAIDALKETIQKNALALQRKADIQAQIDRLEADLAKEKEAAVTEINALGSKYVEIKAEIGKVDGVLREREKVEKSAETLRDLEASLVTLQADIDRLTANQTDVQTDVHEVEAVIAKLKADRQALATDPQIAEAEKEGMAATFRLTGIITAIDNLIKDSDLVVASQRIAIANDKVKSLSLRDPACQSSTCNFIVEALKAKASLPELEAARDLIQSQVDSKRAELQTNMVAAQSAVCIAKAKLEGHRAEVKALQQTLESQIKDADHALRNHQQIAVSTTGMITSKRQQIAEIRNWLAMQKALADKLPEIQIADARKADFEKQLAEVTKQGQDKKKAWETKEAEAKATLAYHYGAKAAYKIDDLAEASLKMFQAEIHDIETRKIPTLEKEIQRARDKIVTLKAELTKIEDAEKELQEVQNQKELLVRNVSSWRYLQFACGKTGLQNLRMGAAAPLIVHNANKLLSWAFNALYSVKLQDQDEEGREDMSIKIIMENGKEILLDLISGGQRVWCVQSIILAMSMLNQEKSGKRFTYFCADESDGALDVENAERYTALYRPFMQEADLERLIFISHRPECRAAGDHILTFAHGKNPEWG